MANKLVTVSVSKQQVSDLRETLVGITNGVPRALSGAINKTLGKTRTRAIRVVTDVLRLKRAEVSDRIGKPRKASPGNLTGSIHANRKKGVPLYKFPHRQAKRGVMAAVWKGKGYELEPHTFIATMPNGKVGVFRRIKGRSKRVKVKKGGKWRWTELPIEQKYGPNPVGVLAAAGRADALQAFAQDDLINVQIPSQIDRLLAKQRADESAPEAE